MLLCEHSTTYLDPSLHAELKVTMSTAGYNPEAIQSRGSPNPQKMGLFEARSHFTLRVTGKIIKIINITDLVMDGRISITNHLRHYETQSC